MTDAKQQTLQGLILDEIAAKGGIDFARFMELCLYQPEHGYYMRQRARIGKQGDFFTSSSVHALFGRLIGRQLAQMAELLDAAPFVIVEQGAGEGHLAKDILDYFKSEKPELYGGLEYRIVELSPDNRQRQAESLAGHTALVSWCGFDDLEPFSGCFLSNELLDAFPVRVAEKRGGELVELHVVSRDGELGEELRPASTELHDYFAWLGNAPCEGNRGEANLGAVDWVRAVGRRLERGFVLTIDYGYPTEELYAPIRRNGTLMCYHKHSSNDDPYQMLGEQDITAHVDFSAVQKAGAELQLELLYFEVQYRFLMALGFVEELMQLQAQAGSEAEATALRMSLKNLIMPEQGMGSTFKVLVQGKGVGKPELLCQRRITDIPLPLA